MYLIVLCINLYFKHGTRTNLEELGHFQKRAIKHAGKQGMQSIEMN